MISKSQIESYFYVSKKKFIITSFQKDNLNKIFSIEEKLDNEIENLDFEIISKVLDQKIDYVEKNIKKFIDEIILVIDDFETLKIPISYKKKTDGNSVTVNDLKYILNDIKTQIKTSYKEFVIAHLVVDNYFFDKEIYKIFPNNQKCDNFFVNTHVILIERILIEKFEEVFKKKQISIQKVLCAKYVKQFMKNEQECLMSMSKEINNGYNISEVKIVPKILKKKGFFERFFDIFG